MNDILIVGQGLAGSLLAIDCIQRGLTVAVVDNGHRSSSTKIAAGMMNPVIGKRLTRLWPNDSVENKVKTYYKSLEKLLGTSLIKNHRLIRELMDEASLRYFEKRQKDPEYTEYLTQTDIHGSWKRGQLQYCTEKVMRVDAPELLRAAKAYIQQHAHYEVGDLAYTDIDCDQCVSWPGGSAKRVVFCEGARGKENPFFQDLEFTNAMGHILSLEIQDIPENTILNHGKWICPVGNGLYKYGATSFWDDTPAAHEHSKTEIQRSLDQFYLGEYTIKNSEFGVRPVLHSRQPFAGWSPLNPNVGMINGLGGQGFSLAPLVVRKIIDAF